MCPRLRTSCARGSALVVDRSFNAQVLCFLWQVWTIAVMFLSKKFRLLPHMFTLNLFLAQVSPPKEKNKIELLIE